MNHNEERELVESLDIIDLQEIARMIGVDYQHIKTLRNRDSHNCCPNALPPQLKIPGRTPLYLRKEILEWARQTGRVDMHGNPIRRRKTGE